MEQEAVATKAEVTEEPKGQVVKQTGQYVEGGWQDDNGRFHPSLDLVFVFLFLVVCGVCLFIRLFVCLAGWFGSV